jgi:hypothetical protein
VFWFGALNMARHVVLTRYTRHFVAAPIDQAPVAIVFNPSHATFETAHLVELGFDGVPGQVDETPFAVRLNRHEAIANKM